MLVWTWSFETCWGSGILPPLSKTFSDLSLLIYALSDYRFPEASSLIDTLFTLISFTFLANISVDLVSSEDIILGLMLAIKCVFELPPRESLSKNVSLESL